MNLIKIGDTFINLDNVTSAEITSGGEAIEVTFIGEEHGRFSLRFEGDESEALRWYLANTAVDARYERAIR